MIQEPMTSLNPVYTTGDQVMEANSFTKCVADEAKERTIELEKWVSQSQKLEYTCIHMRCPVSKTTRHD